MTALRRHQLPGAARCCRRTHLDECFRQSCSNVLSAPRCSAASKPPLLALARDPRLSLLTDCHCRHRTATLASAPDHSLPLIRRWTAVRSSQEGSLQGQES